MYIELSIRVLRNLAVTMTSWRPYCRKNEGTVTVAFLLRFSSNFVKKKAVIITRFGIEFQHSRSKTFMKNGRQKFEFLSKMAAKTESG